MVLVGTFFLAQKQPPEVLYKKAGLENFAKFTGKHLCKSLFLIKLQISACNFTKKETLSPVNFAKFLRTPFSQNTSGRLLLIFGDSEAAIGVVLSWFYKKVFLKTLQNLQENTCTKVLFLINIFSFSISVNTFLKILFLQNNSGQLLLNVTRSQETVLK